MTAAVLTEHEAGAHDADIFRAHDLVSRAVLEHSVLVNSRFVCEGVFPNDGFVSGHVHPGDARNEPRGRIKPSRLYAACDPEKFLAGPKCHDDLFEAAVSGPFADPVDRALDLARTGPDGGQAVGHGHAEVVMTMDTQGNVLDALDMLVEVAEQAIELCRDRIPDRVRDVYRCGSGLDRCGDYLREIRQLGTRGVLR